MTKCFRIINKCPLCFTILSAAVQGVLEPGRIEMPYALNVVRKWTFSKQMLAYYSLIEKLRLGEESDRCEQNVNKHLLVESAAYFGLQKVINA